MSLQNSLNAPLGGNVIPENILHRTFIETVEPIFINTTGTTLMKPFQVYILTATHTLKLPLTAEYGDKFTAIARDSGVNIIISVESDLLQTIFFHPTSGLDAGATLQTNTPCASITMICATQGTFFNVLSTNGTATTMS